MANRTFTAIACVGVAICIAAAGFFAWREYTRPRIDISKYLDKAPGIELMHESTKEWVEEHHRAETGKDEFTRIIFRSGNVGFRFFRPDGTLREVRVNTAAGTEVAHLFYSPRGSMVVSGFEKRNDGTMRRDVRQEGEVVETRIFWQDGKTLFAREFRKVEDSRHTVTYFHPNGARWAEQSGYTFANADTEKLYDTNDRLVRSYVLESGKNEGWVRYFNGDFVRAEQTYLPYSRTEYGPGEGAYEVTSRGLKNIDEFGSNGQLLRHITMQDGGTKVESVDVYNPETGDIADHVVFEDRLKAPGIEYAPNVLSNDIKSVNAMEIWKKAEALVSDTVETQ
jgi:hypothetical protein